MTGGQGRTDPFEFTEIGGQVRFAVIGGRSGPESVVIAPAGARRQRAPQLGMAKLRKRMEEAGLRLDAKPGL